MDGPEILAEGLHELAVTKTVGLYNVPMPEGEGMRSHIVVRTRSLPYQYYHRVKEGDNWAPWHPIGLSLQSDHVLPVEHNSRLFLFWVTLEADAVQQGSGVNDPPPRRWNFALSWSEFSDGTWSPAQRCAEVAKEPAIEGYNSSDRSSYLLRARVDDQQGLFVEAFRPPYRTQPEYNIVSPIAPADVEELYRIGSWSYDPCLNTFVLAEDLDPTFFAYARPPYAWTKDNHHDVRSPFVTALAGSFEADGSLDIHMRKPVLLVDSRGATARLVTTGGTLSCTADEPFAMHLGSRLYWITRLSHQAITPDELERRVKPSPRSPKGDARWGSCAPTMIDPQPSVNLGLSKDVAMRNLKGNQNREKEWKIQERKLQRESQVDQDSSTTDEEAFGFSITAMHHPYTCMILTVLRRDGPLGLLSPRETGSSPTFSRQQITDKVFDEGANTYLHELTPLAEGHVPIDEINFDADDPFADYNWELFVHAPLFVALRLTADRQYDEALKWFHTLFDPLNRNTSFTGSSRYWRAKPLLEQPSDDVTFWASLVSGNPSVDLLRRQASLEGQLDIWREDPFQPHLLARLRYGAYQRTIVMKYLDTLIAWADDLFRQDSMESINEATQLYVLAAELLGDRPEVLQPVGGKQAHAYDNVTVNSVVRTGLKDLLWASQELAENAVRTTTRRIGGSRKAALRVDKVPALGLGYFCVPINDKMLGYWDKVADRLFKIRHCMDIDGRVRQLPLFQPPIDPGLLVRAAAAGLRLSDVLSGANAPRGPYRFTTLVSQARALTGNVRSLGQALLSALEKKDGEELSRIRAKHEVGLLEAGTEVRRRRIDEAREQLAGLSVSRRQVKQRGTYYRDLMSTKLLRTEEREIKKTKSARNWELSASVTSATAGLLSMIPDFQVGLDPKVKLGGYLLHRIVGTAGSVLSMKASWDRTQSSLAGMAARNTRRTQEWSQQLAQANIELENIETQITASEIRLAVAQRELQSHELQIRQSNTVRVFMDTKFSSKELYRWMSGQLTTLHFQSYQLALDMAKRAQACFAYELGEGNSDFISFGHYDSRKKGLLAGERLTLDLDRMEAAWFERHRREHELTRTISLGDLDPFALELLKTKGICYFQLPEVLFDVDFPGHFKRRIKTVSMTVAATSGRFTNLNATLTLMESATRLLPKYGTNIWAAGTDSRQDRGVGESIAVSGGQDDAGVFNLDLRDARYLPFEGRGTVSIWRFELTGAEETLPGETSPSVAAWPRFDWQSISDVAMTVRYTARDGGFSFRKAVNNALTDRLKIMAAGAGYTGLTSDQAAIRDLEPPSVSALPPEFGQRIGLSMRTDMPDAWRSFLDTMVDVSGTDEHQLILNMPSSLFGELAAGKTMKLDSVDARLVLSDDAAYSDGADVQLSVTHTTVDPATSIPTSTSTASSLAFTLTSPTGLQKNLGEPADDASFTAGPIVLDGDTLTLQTSGGVSSVHAGVRVLVGTRQQLDPTKITDMILVLHVRLT